MTREAFLKRHAGYNNRVILGVTALTAVLVPGAFLIHHVYEDCPTWPMSLRVAVIAVASVCLIAGVALLMTYEEQQRRRFGMACSHCHVKIGGRSAVDFDTGTCRDCGGKLWDD